MKKIITSCIAAAAILFAVSSCNTNAGNMTQMGQLKDTIFAHYPTIAAVLVNVEDDNTLVLAIGSQDLYNADDLRRQNVANDIGGMAMRIFGKDNKLEHGTILVTANEANQEPRPAGALVSQMDFVTLKNGE